MCSQSGHGCCNDELLFYEECSFSALSEVEAEFVVEMFGVADVVVADEKRDVVGCPAEAPVDGWRFVLQHDVQSTAAQGR